MRNELVHWWHVLWDAYEKFNRDDGWAIASHVALSSLFALFPFLVFATSVAAFFERHILEGAVVGAASSLVFGN